MDDSLEIQEHERGICPICKSKNVELEYSDVEHNDDSDEIKDEYLCWDCHCRYIEVYSVKFKETIII